MCYCESDLFANDQNSELYHECYDLKELKLASSHLNYFTGIFITLANYGFRFIIINNVKDLKFKSLSNETFWIKYTISKFSFFIKCILIILIGANFEYTTTMFNGTYSDFNKHWFLTNGDIIISSTASCIFLPIINYFYNLVMYWFYRA